MPKAHQVIVGYFAVSSLTIGTTEFIHAFYRYKKNNNTSLESIKMSISGFFFGMILGPAAPIFYLAGVNTLDWKQCPKLK